MMHDTQKAASLYLRLGFKMVVTPPGKKAPVSNGWLNDPLQRQNQVKSLPLGMGLGLLHSQSATAALDIDNPEHAARAFETVGINLEDLLTAPGPKIKTPRSLKPIYRLSEGLELSRHALAWKMPDGQPVTVFELRAGNTLDMLPPSHHPSGDLYEWVDGPPRNRDAFPLVPDNLLALWQNWPELKAMLEAASPYYVAPPPKRHVSSNKPETGASVIARFNEVNDLRYMLAKHGYRPQGDRFIAPSSSTGIPGVTLFTGADGVERCFSHHGSDALADEHSHDAFSVYALYEFGGDVHAAVREAAQKLGMKSTAEPKQLARREMSVNDEPTEDSPQEDDATFPLEVYPEAVRCRVAECAAALPVPVDNLAVAVLPLAGAAIGTSREIEVKPGWREGPRFYNALVAEPGTKKSPALAAAAKPFYERQREAHLEYKAAYKAYTTKLLQYEADRLTWRRGDGAGAMPTPPDEPTMTQCFTTDATLEAVVGLLEKNPRGIGSIQDEMSGLMRGLNQYKGGRGNDRQKLLSFWAGATEVVNRKGQEPLVLNNPLFNIIGNLPPDILSELTDEQGRSDGFLDRFLFCYPDPVPLAYTEATVSPEAERAYTEVFKHLWQLEPEVGEDGQVRPKVLPLSEAGRAAFREWIETHYAEMNAPSFSPRLRGAWSKLDGYVARFALVLQLLRAPESTEVDAEAVYGAAALATYFKAHARRVYSFLHATASEKHAEAVLEYLMRQPGKRISLRDLVRSGAGKVRNAKDAKAALQLLQEQGIGEFVDLKYPSGQKGEGFELSG